MPICKEQVGIVKAIKLKAKNERGRETMEKEQLLQKISSPQTSLEEIGEAVRELRIALNMSLSQFAKDLGVTPPTVYRWQDGKMRPRLSSVDKMRMIANGGIVSRIVSPDSAHLMGDLIAKLQGVAEITLVIKMPMTTPKDD